MTVCAAAICTYLAQDGSSKRAIIGVCDRMVTAGDVEYEPLHHTKIYAFSPCPNPTTKVVLPTKAVALSAGLASTDYAVSVATHREMQSWQADEITVERVAETYAKHLELFKRTRIERNILSPFCLTIEAFRDGQHKLPSETTLEIADRIKNEHTEVFSVIVGIDPNGDAQIYSVGGYDKDYQEDMQPVCHTKEGVWAVGTGANHLQSMFQLARYDALHRLPDALFLAYCAKKRAEVSPGVGRYTDLFTIDRKYGFRLFSRATVDALEEHYRALEDDLVEARRLRLIGVYGDMRILPRRTDDTGEIPSNYSILMQNLDADTEKEPK